MPPASWLRRVISRICLDQLGSARRSIHAQRRFDVPGSERDQVVEAFALACLHGDIQALVAVLDPDVVSRADGGSAVTAARQPVIGALRVAGYLLGVLGQEQQRRGQFDVTIEPVNGRTGIVARMAGVIVGVLDLAIIDRRVAEITLLVNPAKLDGHTV